MQGRKAAPGRTPKELAEGEFRPGAEKAAQGMHLQPATKEGPRPHIRANLVGGKGRRNRSAETTVRRTQHGTRVSIPSNARRAP